MDPVEPTSAPLEASGLAAAFSGGTVAPVQPENPRTTAIVPFAKGGSGMVDVRDCRGELLGSLFLHRDGALYFSAARLAELSEQAKTLRGAPGKTLAEIMQEVERRVGV